MVQNEGFLFPTIFTSILKQGFETVDVCFYTEKRRNEIFKSKRFLFWLWYLWQFLFFFSPQPSFAICVGHVSLWFSDVSFFFSPQPSVALFFSIGSLVLFFFSIGHLFLFFQKSFSSTVWHLSSVFFFCKSLCFWQGTKSCYKKEKHEYHHYMYLSEHYDGREYSKI